MTSDIKDETSNKKFQLCKYDLLTKKTNPKSLLKKKQADQSSRMQAKFFPNRQKSE